MVPSNTTSLSATTITFVRLAATTLSSKRSFGDDAGFDESGVAPEVAPCPSEPTGMAAVNEDAAAADVVSSSEDGEAFFCARLSRNSRIPNQPPAASAITMIAAIIQASQGWSAVTAGGLPVQTGTVWRSPTASVYSATIFSSSRPR